MRIIRFRPPEIVATLTSGGTLAPNTTYYVAGFFRKTWIYNHAASIFSNVESFTTDNTNRSVSVAWKVTVPIQSFQYYGGRTQVNSTNHCLTDGNTIVIESGVYAGTHTVWSWLSYNSFVLDITYISSYSTTLRVESVHNTMQGLMMYLSTTIPFSGNPTLGTWQGNVNNFSHYTWDAGISANPVVITAPYTTLIYGGHPQIIGTINTLPPWCKAMEKGTVYIIIVESTTVAALRQECINADVTDVAFVSDQTFALCGILDSQGSITFTDMSITCYMGMMGGTYAGALTAVIYLRCSVQFLLLGYGAYFFGGANLSTFLFKSWNYATGVPISSPYGYPIGANNTFISTSGIAAEGMGAGFTVENMTVNSNVGLWLMDFRYDTNHYNNCRINKGQVYIYYAFSPPNSRILNGMYIDSADIYDIMVPIWYETEYNIHIKNIDTPRADNKKYCYWNYGVPSSLSVYFYRGGTITIRDKGGVPIVGAIVRLVDNHAVAYSYTSDINGQIIFEVLEQHTVANQSYAGLGVDTFYEDWVLTVTKNSYSTYESKSKIAKDIEKEISLSLIPDLTPEFEGTILFNL